MRVDVNIDKSIVNERVLIEAKEKNEEIEELIHNISCIVEKNRIVGLKDEKLYILNCSEIESIYSSNGKVYAKRENKDYVIKNKLYELEDVLSSNFIRISNSEIINFENVEAVNLHFVGTIEFKFKSGYITYASRRSIRKIKDYLNI